ncbi:MAG: TetR/AcrR family transcriptional regulator [Actinobacteria bacterium]|nr:TetR/AcrR family transcriptional regulator [Actinomycetota bacterium]
MSTGTRRQLQAEQTRADILQAARRLFAAQGYRKTSVAEIAADAGVSVQTIYDSVGSKPAIVRGLNDFIDAESEVGPIAQRLFTSDDPREIIDLAASIGRNICDRCGDIERTMLEARGTEPELASVYDEGIRRHREGIRRTVERLAAMKALRKGVSVEHAFTVLGALTEPPMTFLFVDEYGWTFAQWHEWTVRTLCDLLLKPPV